MSILLDALKKSENQRRLGSAPTLETPEFNPQNGQRHIHSWVPLVLSLAAAAAILWLGLDQFHQPGGDAVHSVAATAELPTVDGSEIADSTEIHPVATQPEHSGARASRNNRSSTKAQTATTPMKDYRETQSRTRNQNTHRVAQTGAKQPKKSQDLPLKTFSRQDTVPASSQSPGNDTRVKSAPLTGDPNTELEKQVQAARTSGAETRVRAPSQSPANTSDQTTGDSRSADGELEPYVTEPISYWQLPQSLRDSLGELRVSVLVYSENPQDRFLLVNGQRLREQEELDDGLLLLEIQRDRAIFSYRNYRFQLKS